MRALVDLAGVELPGRDLVADGADGVGELGPAAVVERERERHARGCAR